MLRLCILILSFAALDTSGESIQEGPTPRMKLIGVYNGHSYFYENTQWTWRQAGDLCGSQGMKLAEIYNLNSLSVLRNYHESDAGFPTDEIYWLAGVDSMTPSQFVWDDTRNEIATELPWIFYNGPHTCVAYYKKSLLSYSCTGTNGVICQT